MERTKKPTEKPTDTPFQRTKAPKTELTPPKQGDTVLFCMEGDSAIYKGLVLSKGDGYYKVTAIDGSVIVDATTQVRQKYELVPRTFYRVERDNFGNPSVRLTHIRYYRANYNEKRLTR